MKNSIRILLNFIYYLLLCESKDYSVALIGDSLFRHPYDNYNLFDRMTAKLPNYNITYKIFAEESNMINMVRETQLPQILELNPKPDVVLLFWDTDCSDIEEYKYTKSEVTQIRAKYVKDLSFVVKSVLDAGK